MVEPLHAGALAGVPHGFMTRRGGVSRGAVAGLNCGLGAGDDPASVRANRRLAADAVLAGAPLVGVHQIHSPDVVTVREPWPDDARPRADALVTDRPGLLIGVLTADCGPLLFADRAAGVIGAAHAGWRGAHGGVIENTVAAMVALGARRGSIAAALGPTIAQPSYEVAADFADAFAPEDADLFAPAPRAGHRQFDLPGYIMRRLRAAGVGTIEWLGRDTYAEPDAFYSYRRAVHCVEPSYGRLLSLIGLASEAN